jgi:hypothetical protein
MNKDSEVTKKWMKKHPERVKVTKAKKKDRKLRLRNEALCAIKKAKHKTPSKAIRAYCNLCPIGVSRSGFDYAPVECKKKKCPLYSFRNGDPNRIKMALKIPLQRVSMMRDSKNG